MKKILALVACLSLVASLAIGGSIAYLTDRDSEANVFTIGNVEIDLSESFDQGSLLLPGVDIEKKPVITNTGDNNAWVWATIAFPAAFDNDNASLNAIHFNYESDYVNDTMWTWKDADGNWNYKTVTLEDGVAYNLYTVLYQTALKPGDVTEPVMTNVYMDKNIDIAPDGKMYRVVNGEATELDWNVNEDGAPAIYVSAYAIQETGFATVQDAYAAYNTQWGDKGTEYGTPAAVVKTAEELKNALKAGGAVILSDTITLENGIAPADGASLDLNGYKIIDASAGGRTFGAQNGASFTITGDGAIEKDATVSSKYAMPLYISNGTVTVNGGTYNMGAPSETNYNILLQNSGKLIINDGKFTNTANYPLIYAIWSSTVEINGGFFESIGATNPDLLDLEYDDSRISTITIKGGTFVNYNPSEDNEGDRVVVADGYKVVSETQENGDIWYTVAAE